MRCSSTPRASRATARCPAGYVYVDGTVGDIGHGVLRDRQKLAEEGVVMVVVTVDPRQGTLSEAPVIETRGWVHAPEAEELLGEASDVVGAAVTRPCATAPATARSSAATPARRWASSWATAPGAGR